MMTWAIIAVSHVIKVSSMSINPMLLSLINFEVDAAVHFLYPRSKARAYQTSSIFLVRYRHTL